MPTYKIGGKTVKRKNFYMPCIIGPRFDSMTDEEKAAMLKATAWADLITNSEWPAVLRHDDAKAYARSRLKKKAAFWLIALGRIALLNRELYADAVDQAMSTYKEQIEQPYPLAIITAALWGHRLDPNKSYTIEISVQEIDDEADE